jgi:hypothetical protein
LLLSGCNLIQTNVHTNFTYHERYPCVDSCKLIKTDGQYEWKKKPKEINQLNESFYFYKDGKFLYDVSWAKLWGHYYIKSDSLLIQYFYLDGTGFYYRNTIDVVGRISSDSIIIYKEKCSWCNKRIGSFPNGELLYSPPRIYGFKTTASKPDSTTAFYYNKLWYNEGLAKRGRRGTSEPTN